MKDGFQRREALLREQERIVNQINTLDSRMKELKFLYEQYFIGMERTEPQKLRAQVNSMIKDLSGLYIKSTAQKFKLRGLISKYGTYSKLWDRVVKEIEEGKYKRDIFRLKVKEWQTNHKKKKEETKKDPIEVLFKQYVNSKLKCKEPVDNLKREKFQKTITTQVSQIKKNFKCKSVSFKVVVENGKTKLKAIPKN